MCGRFTLRQAPNVLIEQLALNFPDVSARYNIAPTQEILAVREATDGATNYEVASMRWGLVPSWAKDPSIGNRMINARSETAAEKPSFRSAFKRRRCVVPADGYYEWQKRHDGKQPYLFAFPEDRDFALAALWERWAGNEGARGFESVTILTTDANEQTASYHDRMPVILPSSDLPIWLDSEFEDFDYLQSLMRPWAGNELAIKAVSRVVNSPRNDSPACLDPAV